MPDVKISVMRASVNTSIGNQDFTISGFGTPKAALFIYTPSLTDETVANQAVANFGATDGTRQWSLCSSSRNSSASTSNRKRGMTDKCVHILGVTGIVQGEAGFDSWITDGVRINWTSAPFSAQLLTVVLFGGADLTVRADTIGLGTSTSAQTYSSLSAEADLIIGASINDVANDTTINSYDMSFGLCKNNKAGSITQRCVAQSEANGQADGCPVSYITDNKFAVLIDSSAPSTPTYTVSLSNFTSSGFDFTCSASATSDDLCILALSLGGASLDVGTYTPPTTATTSTISTSYTPQFCLLGLSGIPTINTGEDDGDAGVFGCGAIGSATQYCHSVAIEDLSGITDTQSMTDDTAVRLPTHDGASNLYVASLTSMNSSGVNLSYSTANATARQFIYFILQDTSVVATSSLIYSLSIFDTFIQGKERSFIKGMRQHV